MYRNGYHLAVIHERSADDDAQRWLAERLTDARAQLLQRLGFSSAALRLRGLRVVLETSPLPMMTLPPPPAAIGITLRVTAAGDPVTIAEHIYAVTELWRNRWHGVSRVYVADGDVAVPMPADLRRNASAWLGLKRGTVPLESPGERVSRPG